MAADGLCDELWVPLVLWPCSASIAANEFGDKVPLVLLLPDVVDGVVVADVPVAPATALNMFDALF
ncbi:MAG: hypothetical protein ACLP8B_22500 [Xanthobacteraceae bacterium]